MTKEMVKTNVVPNEEGLRILARIIARVYARDIREKTAMKDAKQSQTEGREKRKKLGINNKGGTRNG